MMKEKFVLSVVDAQGECKRQIIPAEKAFDLICRDFLRTASLLRLRYASKCDSTRPKNICRNAFE